MQSHEERKARQREHAKAKRADPAYRAREYEVNRQYRKMHRSSINTNVRAYRKKQYETHEEYRAAQIAKARADYRRLRDRLFAGYGSKCACCGDTERAFLELDHVNGGGKKHYTAKAPVSVYREVILAGFPSIYRLLCANCNRGRQRNGGVCPHQEIGARAPSGAVQPG